MCGASENPAILWCFPASVFLRSSFGDTLFLIFITGTYCWQFLSVFFHDQFIFLEQSVT